MGAGETSPAATQDMEAVLAVEQLRSVGLYEAQIARLLRLKEQHATGAINELTREYKYLEFGKYLVDSHGLHD